MLKRIAYILLIISYFIVGFILIYVNRLSDNDNTNKLIAGFGIIILVSMWLIALFLLSKDDVGQKEDKLTTILKVIAHLPLYLILFPICIVPALIQIISDSFKNKVKPLLKNGFKLTEEKVEKKKIYYLSKENIVLKIREFDLYEISESFGKDFIPIEQSTFFSLDERGDFKEYLFQYYGSDYRDMDLYDPTRKLVTILTQNKNIAIKPQKTAENP
jgi:hypothetical protein